MLTVLIYTVSLLLMVCGLFFVSYMLFNSMIMPENGRQYMTVVPGFPSDDYLCDKVYYAFVQANLMNFSSPNKVIVVDFGVEEEMKERCYELLDKKSVLTFCDISELREKMIETNK